MKSIVTLTLNPSVDIAWEVDDMIPVIKMRSSPAVSYPGGGGINVSRVIKILGGTSIAICTAGWLTGELFKLLLEERGLITRIVPIQSHTRMAAIVFERATAHQFRVTPPGPTLGEADWQACLDATREMEADFIVATGSLPRGVPNDFYARVIRQARARGGKVILDTSGMALFEALKEGCYAVKPNLRELEALYGVKALRQADQEALCRRLIAEGKVEIVALTLGSDGALLVSKDRSWYLASPKVNVQSTVGAGDSFVGGLTFGLAAGRPLPDAFALAVAAGTATCMGSGTELCHRDDVDRLYAEITREAILEQPVGSSP